MMRTVIVDDEEKSGEALRMLLERFFPDDFEVTSMCTNLEEAVRAIQENDPQLVFLDVELKNKKGFELFNMLDNLTGIYVVVTTGHKDYAIEAFKYGVFDFLLKPVSADDLSQTLLRLQKARAKQNGHSKSEPPNGGQHELLFNQRITFATNEGFAIERVSNILYCEAEINYTKIHTLDNRAYTVSKTMKKFEEKLPSSIFFRAHKSYLVNVNHIRFLSKKNDNLIELTDGTKIRLSTRKVQDFINLFD